jgi:hypothetical protein
MDGLGFELRVRKILECGIKVSTLKHLDQNELNALKQALPANKLYGIHIDNNEIEVGLYKGDDPSGLASADTFNSCNNTEAESIVNAKIIVAYSIATANNLIQNNCDNLIAPGDYRKMDKYLQNVLSAANCKIIFDIFESYCDSFLSQFEKCFCPKF